MLMNAEPRVVSHGFETFVPAYRTGPFYGRMTEMPNNEIDARNAQRTAVSIQPKSNQRWNGHTADLQNNGNLAPLTQPIQSNGFHGVLSYNQARATSSRGGFDMHRRESSCPYAPAGSSFSYMPYNFHDPYLNPAEASMPSFNNNHNWPINQDAIDYANEQGPFAFGQTSTAIENKEYDSAAASSAAISCITAAGSPCGSDLDSDRASSTVYSSYSTAGDLAPDTMAESFTSLAAQDDPIEEWWDMGQNNGITSVDSSTLFPRADAIPPSYMMWQPEPVQMPHYQPINTVSPTALSLDGSTSYSNPLSQASGMPRSATLAPTKISSMYRPESSSTVAHSNRESNGQVRSSISRSAPSAVTFDAGSSSQLTSHPRQKLPSRVLSRPHVPILPSNDRGISKGKRRPFATKVSSQLQQIDNSPKSASTNDAKNDKYKKCPVPKRMEQKPNTVEKSHVFLAVPDAAETMPLAERESKDDFLVRAKRAGMSYKDIRLQGGFTEAESTLRGRFRTLTKDKEERVRRPMWKEQDIRLLKKAVRTLCNGSDSSTVKIPWKQVANYISSHGGSYHFGYATCRKRWDELQGCSSCS